MSAESISQDSGIPLGTLQSWEAGNRTPTIEHLPKLAKALGVSVAQLLPKE